MISAVIDQIDWAIVMQVAVLSGALLSVFRMQTAEKLERIVGCNAHHGTWGVLRRASMTLLALGMLWCVMWGYERGWQPWPPFAIVMILFDFNAIVAIVIMMQDIKAHRAGTREVVWRDGRLPQRPI